MDTAEKALPEVRVSINDMNDPGALLPQHMVERLARFFLEKMRGPCPEQEKTGSAHSP